MNVEKIVNAIQEQIDLLDLSDAKQNRQAEQLLEAKKLVIDLATAPKRYKLSEIEQEDCVIVCSSTENLKEVVAKLTVPMSNAQEFYGFNSADFSMLILGGSYTTGQDPINIEGVPVYQINDVDCDMKAPAVVLLSGSVEYKREEAVAVPKKYNLRILEQENALIQCNDHENLKEVAQKLTVPMSKAQNIYGIVDEDVYIRIRKGEYSTLAGGAVFEDEPVYHINDVDCES